MINTVFVIGTGASHEVGLPLGSKLREKIKASLNFETIDGQHSCSGDLDVLNALRELSGDDKNRLRSLVNSCMHISGTVLRASSIDNYIDNHKDNKDIELCSKLVIVKSILDAERNSKLKENTLGQLNHDAFKDSYFDSFFDHLKKHCDKKQLRYKLKQIMLIIFNYDRCVEHYLINSLTSYYDLSPEEAVELFENITIIHPYGTVGALPWQKTTSNKVSFGKKVNHSELIKLAGNIKTFSESRSESDDLIKEIQLNLGWFRKIVFLGFHFHKINLDMFKVSEDPNLPSKKIFATAYGRSHIDRHSIESYLESLMSNKLDNAFLLEAKETCKSLFSEFEFAMSID